MIAAVVFVAGIAGCGTQRMKSSTAAPVITVPVSPHATGSLEFDYGRLRLWLPSGWEPEAASGGPCQIGPPAQRLVLIGDYCQTRPGGDYVVVRRAPATAPTGDRRISVNEVATYSPSSPATKPPLMRTWDVPSLGVQLTFTGATALAVTKTLGPSPLAAVLKLRDALAVPAGWKTVAFGGLTANVPAAWADERTIPGGCGTPLAANHPLVILGNRYGPADSCLEAPIDLSPTDGLWLPGSRLPALGSTGDLNDTLSSGPDRTYISSTPSSGPVVRVVVTSPSGSHYAEVGIGNNPTIAEQVISSLRPATTLNG
jgi:hypothetical protein